jgi:DNA-binding transcriptional regulator YhcF (GntR family)
MQIADFICENILTNNWSGSNKIPSVRELAASIEVNPNTVMRSYSYLQDAGIIYNKRGIGFFVSEGASTLIKELQRQTFIETEIPDFAKKMKLLDISIHIFEKAFKAV